MLKILSIDYLDITAFTTRVSRIPKYLKGKYVLCERGVFMQ